MARRESVRMAGAATPTASHMIEDRQSTQATAGSAWRAAATPRRLEIEEAFLARPLGKVLATLPGIGPRTGARILVLTHRLGSLRHCYDGTRPKDVSMDEMDWLAERFESHRTHLRGGGVPDAWLAERGRRRRAGVVAAAQPFRHQWREEPRQLADDRGRAGVPGHAALTQVAAGGAAGRTCARPDREPRERDRPRARGTAGRIGRSRAAGGPGHPGARRAAGVRAARHVRSALRRDRPYRGAFPERGQAARQPRPPPRARSGPGS